MATIDDVRLPETIEEGAEGGPEFSTSLAVSAGGHEQRLANWSIARGRWNVGFGVQDVSEYAALLSFFRARQGRLRAFRFKDWSDYQMPRTTIGTTDGADATWQLRKSYTSGSVTVTRPITRPVSATVLVWVNNVAIAAGAGGGEYQVNLATGVITLGSTLAATTGQAIEAACDFDVPVRFDADYLPVRLDAFEVGAWPTSPATR
jgi:uncharacterized protein (TIGR02217 family)